MDLRQLIQKAPDTVGSSIMNRRYPKGSIRSSSMTLRQRVLYCMYRHHKSGTLNTLSKEKLANEVCAPLRSLNRVISQCKEEGMIDYRKHQFYITNIGMLEEIICS